MNFKWNLPFKIKALGTMNNDKYSTPGIYVISNGESISRAGGADPHGILYIGKSNQLHRRLSQFRNAWHPASGLLWDHPKISKLILGFKSDNMFEELFVRITNSIPLKNLERAERAVMFAYMFKFGELPPLNFSLPKHWETAPTNSDLHWARRGLKIN